MMDEGSRSKEAGPGETACKAASSRSRIIFAAKLLLAAGLLWWLSSTERVNLERLSTIRFSGFLAAGFACAFLSLLLPTWRWMWLTRIQGLDLSTRDAFRITWLGYFAGLFLPGAAGGDLAKAVVACRHSPQAKTRALSTVLADRAIGVHSILFIGCVASGALLSHDSSSGARGISLTLFGLLFLGTVGLILALLPSGSVLLSRVLPAGWSKAIDGSLALYRRSWRPLCFLWVFSVVCNLLSVAAFVLAALALHVDASVTTTMCVAPLIVVGNALPLTPGGLGIGEWIASDLMSFLGTSEGALIALLVRIQIVLLSLPGALALFRWKSRKAVSWAVKDPGDMKGAQPLVTHEP
jgi:glycosyltransferase 2 family protein